MTHRKSPEGAAARSTLSRRRFLGGGAALAAAAIVPRHVLGGAGFTPPSETLNVAVIGTGGRGKQLTNEMTQHGDVRVIAIADPNERADYERFNILFAGTKGKLLMGGWSQNPRLLPKSRMQEFAPPPKTLRRVEAHDRAWLDACKGGPPASSNFGYGGPLTEVVLLGQVAVRTGEKLHWDAKALKATNCAEADRYLRAEYRQGWGV
jgi:hypothetical protein